MCKCLTLLSKPGTPRLDIFFISNGCQRCPKLCSLSKARYIVVMLGSSISLALSMRLSSARSTLCTSMNSSASLCPGESSFCKPHITRHNRHHSRPSLTLTHDLHLIALSLGSENSPARISVPYKHKVEGC